MFMKNFKKYLGNYFFAQLNNTYVTIIFNSSQLLKSCPMFTSSAALLEETEISTCVPHLMLT